MLKIAISVMWSVIVLWVPGNETIMSCHKPILLRENEQNNSLTHTTPYNPFSLPVSLKADLHGTTLLHTTSLRQAYNMKCLQLAYNNNCRVVPKSCCRPIVSLLCATKSYRINEPLQLLPCCPCFYGNSKLSTTVSFKNCGNFCVFTCH